MRPGPAPMCVNPSTSQRPFLPAHMSILRLGQMGLSVPLSCFVFLALAVLALVEGQFFPVPPWAGSPRDLLPLLSLPPGWWESPQDIVPNELPPLLLLAWLPMAHCAPLSTPVSLLDPGLFALPLILNLPHFFGLDFL